MAEAAVLSPRWTQMRGHKERARLWRSRVRFKIVAAGRRSGKTEDAKRNVVLTSLSAPGDPYHSHHSNPRYFCGAPTRDQAKRIYWEDLKQLMPRDAVHDISESELTIKTVLGSEIVVLGMDKPERIEGSPWDGGVLDEYGNMKEKAWREHVRPALSDRNGWCWLIGVPEGRNHYYDLKLKAEADALTDDPEWDFFTWHSSVVLNPKEIEAAKRDLDELTFQQEYEASFVNFTGRAYYNFGKHNERRLEYDPKKPLCFCFDFNVDPGVAAVAQIMKVDGVEECVGFIGEVWIPQNSNTPAVVRKLIADWGDHQGQIRLYGDATGGARGTAQTEGNDWEIIKRMMRAHYGDRVLLRVPASNPTERSRINAVNSLAKSIAGIVRLYVDPVKCPKLVRDFDGVRTLEGGSGEIDKKHDKKLTHISDGGGYMIVYEFPVSGKSKIQTARVTGF